MKKYSVALTKSARKEFNSLPSKIQSRVTDVLKLLEINPFSDLLQIKKLKGEEHLYRTRVGDYRVVYEIRRNLVCIVVIKIGHRKEIYRNL